MPDETEVTSDTKPETRAQRKFREQVERTKELEQCLTDIKGVLDKYNATFNVTRIVTIGPDSVERVQAQVSVVSL